MRSRPGPGRLRHGTEDRPTGPIEGTYGLHQAGSDLSEAPSATIVQGIRSTKIRSFSPLPLDVSLEELAPKDHFYRRLEAQGSTSRS
jgi:hypothetical protein